jgi:hypothetical protein
MAEKINAYATLIGKPWCGWEDNIKRDLKEIGWDAVDRFHDQDKNQLWAFFYSVTKFRFP